MEINPVIESLQGTVTSIAASDGYVYIGTAEGILFLYKVTPKESFGGKISYTSYLEGRKSISGATKKPIQELFLDAELERVIVLCDGNVTFHDMTTLDQVAIVKEAKGATTICIDRRLGSHRLCAGFKRKLILFKYDEWSCKQYNELTIPDTVASIGWNGPSICVGYRREYFLLYEDTGAALPLFPLDKSGPLVTLLPTDEALLRLENVGVFVGTDGDKRGYPSRSSITWGECPTAVGQCFPYVVGLVSRGIEVYSLYEQALMQTIPFKQGLMMADDKRGIFLAAQKGVYLLTPVPFAIQIRTLINDLKVTEALDLFDKTFELNGGSEADKESARTVLYQDAAFACFNRLKFAESYDFFLKGHVDIRDIIYMFPELQPPGFSHFPQNASVRANFPVFVQQALRDREKRAFDEASGSEASGSPSLSSPLSPPSSSPSASSSMSSAFASSSSSSPAIGPESTGRVVEESLAMVQRLFETLRKPGSVNNSPPLSPEDLSIQQYLDFALLKLYAEREKGLKLEALLFPINHCVVASAEPPLKKAKLYSALALLYKSKGMFAEALEIWEGLGSGKYAEAGRDGVQETIEMLRESENPHLIFRFSRWVLDKNPDKAIHIFVKSKRKNRLLPDQIWPYIAPYPEHISQAYLEYLILEEQTKEGRYHTQFATQLISAVSFLKPPETATSKYTARVAAGEEKAELGRLRSKLLTHLNQPIIYYHIPTVLSALKTTTLYQEMIIVHTKAGQPDEALRVIVFCLNDIAAAERYCSTNGTPQGISASLAANSASSSSLSSGAAPSAAASGKAPGSSENSLYVTLLQILLHPPPGKPAKEAEAMSILNAHAAEINVVKILDILPPHFSIAKLQNYLTRAIQTSVHARRDGQIIRNLARMENLDTSVKLISSTKRCVLMTNDRMCPVCNKRIGDAVFAVFPNEVIVHFRCKALFQWKPPAE